MVDRRIGHAVIGCGRVAPNHADAFRQLPAWEILWACDVEPGSALRFAQEQGIPNATESVEEVLADPTVVSVSIAVDHAMHAPLAEAALSAGKHVLVEKPLAVSLADGERVTKLAADRGLILSTVSQHRYDPLVSAVHGWIREGLLGRLLYSQVSLEARREPEYYSDSNWRGTWSGEGGSALINQGYHCLDVARYLLGDMEVQTAVAASGGRGGLMETEDSLSALLLAGDTPITLHVTVASTATWRTRVTIVGTEGTLEFDLDHPGKLHRCSGNPELERLAELERQRSMTEEPPGINYYGVSHRRQIEDFGRAVQTGSALRFGPDVGLGMVALLEEIYQATGLRAARSRVKSS
ncbi:Gfo/Idh/MocA family oxidoreductase [Streptomyces sp. GZWMJZ-114]|uniref:Gfo/Idh/MocA family protein n=1 Tax=Streptomyces sp. GZWMJZ-114 TaxID=2494734 RepID=UPI0010122ABB|nr:Gfo/Idh/MocA family oxidoreductase [Streptomyces sp. GZWMJZ-114]